MVPWLREEEALRLHAALLEDSLRLLRAGAADSGAVPFVSFSESWNPRLLPEWRPIASAATGIRRLPQRGVDLGARLEASFRRLFTRRFRRVVVIGSDSPTLPRVRLREAFAELDRGAEVVLVPAKDGGYCLVGATRLVPPMFQDIPWGTARVLRATVAALRCCGARHRLLDPWFDVDRPADLEKVRRDLARLAPGGAKPESTRSFIEGLTRDGRLPFSLQPRLNRRS